jgi:hypothetical protein
VYFSLCTLFCFFNLYTFFPSPSWFFNVFISVGEPEHLPHSLEIKPTHLKVPLFGNERIFPPFLCVFCKIGLLFMRLLYFKHNSALLCLTRKVHPLDHGLHGPSRLGH